MSSPRGAKKPATYADLEALPAHMVGQIIDGELIALPRPAVRHAHVSSALGSALFQGFGGGGEGPGGWWILFEPELHVGPNVLVPDIAGWRRSRLPELPDTAALELAPDWVCEVLSPSTERIDRLKKANIYAHHGVEWLWLVGPAAGLIEVFRLKDGVWSREAAVDTEAPAALPPFEALELNLPSWWPRGE